MSSNPLPLLVVLLVFVMAVAPAFGVAPAPAAPGLPPAPSAAQVAGWGPQANTSSSIMVADTVPIENGGFLSADREFLIFVGITSWGGTYNVVANNSQVYASQLVLVIYSLLTYEKSIPISLHERGQWFNTSNNIAVGVANEITVSLVPDNSWTTAILTVDFTTQRYYVAVPISLLPNSITTVGGLDLVSLAIISECLIGLALAVAAAYAAMRRALFAPVFSLLIWGHVILIGAASLVILQFQLVDSLFAGYSPLVYAVFLVPVFFLFSLSFFNRAPKVELLQATAPLSGSLGFNRWTLRVARDTQGRYVICGPRWRDFFARLFGHQILLSPQESAITSAEPFVAELTNRRVLSRQETFRRVRRPSPEKQSPMDSFNVIPCAVDGRRATGRDDPPVKLMFSPTAQPVDVSWSKLVVHSERLVPAKLGPDGSVVEQEHYERRLSFPHYSEGRAAITLHTIHFRSAISVVAGWRSVESLAGVLSDTQMDLEVLKSSFDSEVAHKVRERLVAYTTVLNFSPEALDAVEASQRAEREREPASPTLDQLLAHSLTPKSIAPKHVDPHAGSSRGK